MLLLSVLRYYLTFCGVCLLAVALVVASQVYAAVVARAAKKDNGGGGGGRRRKYTVSCSGDGRER